MGCSQSVRLRKAWFVLVALCLTGFVRAELQELDDDDLSSAQGSGVGLVIEDFSFDGSTGSLSVGGVEQKTPSGSDVEVGISVTRLYLKGEGSRRGIDDVRYGFGSIENPLRLDILSGSDIANVPDTSTVLQVAWPTYQERSVDEVLNDNSVDLNGLDGLLAERRVALQDNLAAVAAINPTDLARWEAEAAVRNAEIARLNALREDVLDRARDAGIDIEDITDGCGLFGSRACRRLRDEYQEYGDDLQDERTALSSVLEDLTPARRTLSQTPGREAQVKSIEGVIQRLGGGISGADVGISFSYEVADFSSLASDATQTGTRVDHHSYDLTGVDIYGTSLRLFGNSRAGKRTLDGELDLKLYVKSLDLTSCDISQGACLNNPVYRGNRTYYFSDIFFDLRLGYGTIQPLEFAVTPEGHINLRLAPVTSATAADFYANSPKSNIYIGHVDHGGVRPAGGGLPSGSGHQSFGASEVAGLRIQYLDVTTHDL
ncbi:hypothetical protein [Parendozoicomonas sp. Alg238-R29]|uniref:hypothetical protein n=1 Tax=Parendozoicomonas sp. Alg238-R29 TaxID=2993446 RepID=UPI00248E3457|nr:hypothetical protein [Parendozoicomonas sp. Alg238-R29]